jgi:predicted Zn-dependent peptidase
VVEHEVEALMPVAAPLFYLGFKEPAGEKTAKDIAGSSVLLELLAGKSSSLYARLLEEGLINDQFSAEYFGGPGFGLWLFGGESADPARVRDRLVEELKRQQTEGIDRNAFEAVRRGAYGRMLAQLEEPANCAEILLDDLVDGLPPLARLEALAALTVEDAEEQLRRRLAATEHTLSVVRPA